MRNLLLLFLALLLFQGCDNSPKKEQGKDYYSLGAEVVDVTFSALSKQLQGALADGEVKDAVKYCNFIVNPLVDSIARKYNAEIRRITLKPRNILNRPRDYEDRMLLAYDENFEEGRLLKPIVENLPDGTHLYYSPIKIISPLCLKCHGEVGKDIAQKDYDYIKSLYPNDNATGYKEGDLRGVWTIVFYD